MWLSVILHLRAGFQSLAYSCMGVLNVSLRFSINGRECRDFVELRLREIKVGAT